MLDQKIGKDFALKSTFYETMWDGLRDSVSFVQFKIVKVNLL